MVVFYQGSLPVGCSFISLSLWWSVIRSVSSGWSLIRDSIVNSIADTVIPPPPHTGILDES